MKHHYLARYAALSAAVLGLAASSAQAQTKIKTKSSSAGKQKTTVPAPTSSGFALADMDRSVSPCDNFVQFASGSWLKKTSIPAAESSWGTLSILYNGNQDILRRIVDKAAADRTAKPGSNLQKVGDFYAAAMDSMAIEKAGLKYLQPRLDRINAIQDLAGIQAYLADPRVTAKGWYNFGVGQDSKNSSVYAVQLRQGGLGLPDRDNYTKDDARSKALRAAYQQYQVNVFKLLGDDQATAEKNAAAIFRLEARLAKASRERLALRDAEKNYNKMTVDQAAADFPNLNLPLRLKQAGLDGAKEIIVGQPEFLKEVSAMLKEEPLADQKQYLRWRLVSSATAALPKAYGDEAFRYTQVQTGAKQRQPRWKRALAATDGTLGEAFGQLYVDEAFSPAAKARVKQMIENMRVAYAERIMATEWMSAATKAEALKKLNAFTVKIGYPDKWKDYSKLTISRESALNNAFAASEWAVKDNYSKFGQSVDRTEWGMTPPTVNAYYNPPMNEIVFPAGILQPPLFDPKADDAVNYGAIGSVIGHEMTHGFDDQGRKVDSQGNLRDWWTKEDGDKFVTKADVVGKQFDAFVVDSVHVNGKLTMGENLADLGGLTIAYAAFMKTPQAKAGKTIDGFTPEQRFFIGWAQVWRSVQRPEAARQQVQTDPHAPDQFRINGPLQNMPEFQKAFGCKDGDKMVRSGAARAKIW
ncbi:M13 family metallopeptidase [Hymenobacter sp. BT770]|uniref:M13 family metallopeptidase n=1 Tax=Hymenobacter sp. BT770 TaxID=2886942 RepID=UPI001D12C880|nr:M13 family metallopeptidase [Hymenobacter sp. BT770]MCC3151980.1 M13 family metallopeptidase [Hymenobacter sp. BT770]MDO3417090.1 M13 family metallopeptidase [Hymenobacter sp. BT770]